MKLDAYAKAVLTVIAIALVAGSALGSPGGASRLAALAVAVLAAGRVLTADRPWPALGAGSMLSLGLGALGGPVGLVAGALVAAGLGTIDGPAEAER